jgi:V8-like Glu-specific endopeptidase
VLGIVAAPGALGAATGEPPGTPTATPFKGTPTVGPLFASATSTHHFCTASVVHSPRGDVLLTAAHCINGTGAGLVFAPGFHHGVSPYGRWTVTAAYVAPGWLTAQDPRRDFAFLLVAPKRLHGHRRQIEQVTGANHLGFAPHAGQRVTVPAYPAGTNNEPITCTAPVYFEGIYPAFNCNPYPGGTSGSPWLAHGRRVVGLIGGLHQGGCFTWTSYSPPFGRAIHRAYERAVRRATPDVVPPAGSDGC